MSELSKMWAEIDIARRRELLSLFFRTKPTILKHEHKEWTKLPVGFRSYLAREATKDFIAGVKG